MKTMTRLLAGVALVAGLAACSSGGADSGRADQAVGSGGAVAEQPQYDVEEQGADGEELDASGAARQVIVTAQAVVEVDDPATTSDELAEKAAELGGWVDDRHTWAGDGSDSSPPSASVTLRIPAEDLSDVLEGLSDLGTVQEVNQSSDDVTQQVVDLDARIESLRTSTERLREIMADAKDSADLLEAEKALSERQAELESLLSQREHLADQVAMSTLTVNLHATGTPAQVDPGGFLGGLASGWNALLSLVSALLVVAGALVPWLVVVGVPAVIVLMVVRRRRRRHRRRAVAAPETPVPAADVEN